MSNGYSDEEEEFLRRVREYGEEKTAETMARHAGFKWKQIIPLHPIEMSFFTASSGERMLMFSRKGDRKAGHIAILADTYRWVRERRRTFTAECYIDERGGQKHLVVEDIDTGPVPQHVYEPLYELLGMYDD